MVFILVALKIVFVAALICLLGDNIILKRLEAIQRYKTNRYALEGDLADIRRQIVLLKILRMALLPVRVEKNVLKNLRNIIHSYQSDFD
ncbi:hypothetical protein FJZ22_02150 [Candidatus Pacearchaeota archaeon]|nr:hypothetical protein [Candidatus Pacearchaeota archaeon]